jgi:hypothetical protein
MIGVLGVSSQDVVMATRTLAPFRPPGLLLLSLLSVGGRPASSQQSQEITPASFAGVRLCDSLKSVRKQFAQAQDTLIVGEAESDWPGVVVHLGDHEWILFETSWLDRTHIWRITTNSSRYRTRRGYRVGTSVDELVRRGEKLNFDYPEGYLAIDIVSEDVGFQVDDSSARRFFSRFDHKGDPLQFLDKHARIKELTIGVSECRP